MIIVLAIEKIEASLYEVHYECRGVEIREVSQHASIWEALAYCGMDFPVNFLPFVEVHYGGVSSGTTAIARLRDEPQQVANELVAMVAKVAEAHEALQRQVDTVSH